jgi:hypothetical protein
MVIREILFTLVDRRRVLSDNHLHAKHPVSKQEIHWGTLFETCWLSPAFPPPSLVDEISLSLVITLEKEVDRAICKRGVKILPLLINTFPFNLMFMLYSS